nr:PREDICTED: uncharacterized protein LOC109043171 [Bemisia tabaci]XP_018915839.1 PREDICTED: uncharacterized protein LOC109043171 [Bemisia tabaci]XP_018915847.1 PREDICTED: uncharacterized protein LOC109043171 [Bemisia tabaci]
MRLILNTLYKLAVSANLICLLMVLSCGAEPRSVRLYSECSSNFIRVDMRGRVVAEEASSILEIPQLEKFQNLTFLTKDRGLELTIFAEEAKRYLCFNSKWRIIGSKKFQEPMCLFRESMSKLIQGYFQYRSVADPTRILSFNNRGRPIKCPQNKSYQKCSNFLKYDDSFNVPEHNKKIKKTQKSNKPKYPNTQNTQTFIRHSQHRSRNSITT